MHCYVRFSKYSRFWIDLDIVICYLLFHLRAKAFGYLRNMDDSHRQCQNGEKRCTWGMVNRGIAIEHTEGCLYVMG